MTIKQALRTVPEYMEHPLGGLVSKEELNDIEENPRKYDPTLRFRTKVVQDGYEIYMLIAVFYHGWEGDQWAALATKDGVRYRASTDHGSVYYEPWKDR